MTITSGRILFLTLLLTVQALVAQAQGSLTAKANNFQPQTGSGSESDSDRGRDGLLGPVRRIRTEVVKIANADGKLIENGKRVLLEAAEYDLKGAKTVNQYFPVAGSAPTGREVYKYDDKGNISEMTLMGADGSLISKEIYKYEYDSLGNWTKMSTSVAVVESGKISFEPTEVTYRSISYYLDATMTKMLEPANNVAAPVAKSQDPTNSRNSGAKFFAPQETVVAALPTLQRSPIRLIGQSNQSVMPDVRNASFTINEKVAVENAPPPPSRSSRLPVSGGVLNGVALSLPTPIYPDTARRMHTTGAVEVEVVVDENGKVASARALSGPSVLRDSAVQAATRARFTPSKLSGQPVKVTGKIVYNFTMPQ